MSISNLTPQQLRQAADLQEKIASLNIQLALLLDPGSTIPAPFKAAKAKLAAKPKRAKRTISAAHIAKIKAGQKIRWAKYNAAKAKTSAVKPAKKKGGMSAEGRARIVAVQKTRWAKIKGAKKK
jgi:hypothetical protein